jgi:hypothetical protein
MQLAMDEEDRQAIISLGGVILAFIITRNDPLSCISYRELTPSFVTPVPPRPLRRVTLLENLGRPFIGIGMMVKMPSF